VRKLGGFWTVGEKEMKEILSSRDVAHMLDMSPDDVIELARKGMLKATKQGRRWRYREADVLTYQRKTIAAEAKKKASAWDGLDAIPQKEEAVAIVARKDILLWYDKGQVYHPKCVTKEQEWELEPWTEEDLTKDGDPIITCDCQKCRESGNGKRIYPVRPSDSPKATAESTDKVQ
jgi:hypothetical protein